MVDVVVLAADGDAEAAVALALTLEQRGWTVVLGESGLPGAGCAVALWSRASRYDFRFGQAASAAQRAGKLLGVTLDGTTPPYGYPPPEGTVGEAAEVVSAALRLGPAAYHLPVRRRLLGEAWVRLHWLRRDRVGRLWSAFEQLRRRRAAPSTRRRESWWRRLVGR